jgi:hypothetical protein
MRNSQHVLLLRFDSLKPYEFCCIYILTRGGKVGVLTSAAPWDTVFSLLMETYVSPDRRLASGGPSKRAAEGSSHPSNQGWKRRPIRATSTWCRVYTCSRSCQGARVDLSRSTPFVSVMTATRAGSRTLFSVLICPDQRPLCRRPSRPILSCCRRATRQSARIRGRQGSPSSMANGLGIRVKRRVPRQRGAACACGLVSRLKGPPPIRRHDCLAGRRPRSPADHHVVCSVKCIYSCAKFIKEPRPRPDTMEPI